MAVEEKVKQIIVEQLQVDEAALSSDWAASGALSAAFCWSC